MDFSLHIYQLDYHHVRVFGCIVTKTAFTKIYPLKNIAIILIIFIFRDLWFFSGNFLESLICCGFIGNVLTFIFSMWKKFYICEIECIISFSFLSNIRGGQKVIASTYLFSQAEAWTTFLAQKKQTIEANTKQIWSNCPQKYIPWVATIQFCHSSRKQYPQWLIDRPLYFTNFKNP